MSFRVGFDTKADQAAALALQKSLGKLGIEAKDVDKVFDELQDDMRKYGKESDEATKSTVGWSKAAKAATVTGIALAAGIALSVKAYGELETAQVGATKTTNIAGDAMDEFTETLRNLQREKLIPLATNDLLELAEQAGALGVSGPEAIAAYVESAAKLEFTTDLVREQGKELVRLKNITGENIITIDQTSSALVALGNNLAATESPILKTATEIGKATAQFKLSSAEALGLGGALASIGTQAELGSSVIGKTFRTIEKVISDGGQSFERLQEITGMTGDQIRKTFETDAIEVFKSFVKGVGEASEAGQSTAQVLGEFKLKGDEVLKVLPTLAIRYGDLEKALELSNSEFAKGTALQEEAEKAFRTQEASMKRFQNTLVNLAADIGEKFKPAVKEATDLAQAGISELGGLLEFTATGINGIIEATLAGINKLRAALPDREEGFLTAEEFAFRSDEGQFDIAAFGAAAREGGASAKTAANQKKITDEKKRQVALDRVKIQLQKESLLLQEAAKRQKEFDLQQFDKELEKIKEIMKAEDDQAKLLEQAAERQRQQDLEDFDRKLEAIKELDRIQEENDKKRAARQQKINDDAILALTKIGILIAKNEDRENRGRNIGTIAGATIGTATGGAAGGLAGSFIGGEIGGMFDKEQSERIISSAERIADAMNQAAISMEDFNQALKRSRLTQEESNREFLRIQGDIEKAEQERSVLNDFIDEKIRERSGLVDDLNRTTGAEREALQTEYSELSEEIRIAREAEERRTDTIIELNEDLLEFSQAIKLATFANIDAANATKQAFQEEFVIGDQLAGKSRAELEAEAVEAAQRIARLEPIAERFEDTTTDDGAIFFEEVTRELAEEWVELTEITRELARRKEEEEKAIEKNISGFKNLISPLFARELTLDQAQDLQKQQLEAIKNFTGTEEELLLASENAVNLLGLIESAQTEQIRQNDQLINTIESTQQQGSELIERLVFGTLNPQGDFALSQGFFEGLLDQALTGDPEAAKKFFGFVEPFLETAEEELKSTQEFVDLFNQTLSDIGQVNEALEGARPPELELIDIGNTHTELLAAMLAQLVAISGGVGAGDVVATETEQQISIAV
jgi:TP901 family phage tail tape measure protein